MCSEHALTQAIDASPADDAPKLVYADWLDDAGRSEEADTIRTGVRERVRLARNRERAVRIWEGLAKREHAKRSRLSSYLQDVRFVHGYAEPGYSDPECGLIAFGNWNTVDVRVEGPPADGREYRGPTRKDRTMERLGDILEKLGVEIQWSDEWSECSSCGKALRTQPDSWGWRPYWNERLYQAGEFCCLDCEPNQTDDDETEDDETDE